MYFFVFFTRPLLQNRTKRAGTRKPRVEEKRVMLHVVSFMENDPRRAVGGSGMVDRGFSDERVRTPEWTIGPGGSKEWRSGLINIPTAVPDRVRRIGPDEILQHD